MKVCDNDNLIRWDQKDGSCREIVLEFNIHFYDRKICRTQNYLWVFSYFTNEVYRMDHEGRCISKILLDHSENRIWLVFCEETPEGIYFLNLNSPGGITAKIFLNIWQRATEEMMTGK